ncbi:LysM peptidoglycan-binding domain-containing protein [Amnibacterium endophyticum]|uniref:LysM peptidoglycan-binding domain-containing protein n=1 Tax=Amnibacterium endophyticum TaxID=2109337 RepID=A0ABW4LFI1_9MICO
MFAVEDDWIQYEAEPVRRAEHRVGAAVVGRGAAAPVAARSAGVVAVGTPAPRALRAVPAVRTAPCAVPAPAVGSATPPTPTPRLRLTRRGRFVLVVMPALLAVSGATLAVSGTPAAEAAARPVAVRTVVVGSGDTLWSIAERIEPSRDPRQVVAELRAANRLSSAMVPAGAELRLPAAP